MMSLTVETMEGGDHTTAQKAPAEGNVRKVRVAMGAGDNLEPKQRVEKRGRKKGKRERQREASGWRAQLLSCFGCGAGNQDNDQELEKEQVMTEEESLRREKSRKVHKACLQKFRKLAKDDQMRKQAYQRIQKSRRLVEANKKWSALPLKSEEAEKKVGFHEVHRSNIWYFEEDPVPTHICLMWTKIQEELKQNRMEKEEELRKREEGQRALLRQKAPTNHSNPCKALVVFVVLIGYLVYLWLCSQKRRVFQKIRFLK